METLSSSFLPRNPQSFTNASSFMINSKKIQPMIITANSSFITFQQLQKKLTTQTFETLNINIPTPSMQSSLLAIIFNTLDDFICNFIDVPLRPSIDPKQVLSGNYAPVNEIPPTACEVVEGSLPTCLVGAYIRNGPNPQFIPKGPYHFLDGDGMLHMIKISKGKATFCSRYVNTHKYMAEREIGYPFVPSIFASFNGLAATISRSLLIAARVLTKQFDPLNHGCGTANTSLNLFAGHIFALCESDLPYAVQVTPEGDIITLGRHDFQATEPFLRMTAHPKIDRVTKEAFAFGYNIISPFLTFFRINSEGKKQKNVPIFSMQGFAAIHDFAVTKNYAIFPDTQIIANPLWILRGRSPIGVDQAKVPRLGIIPKYAEDESEMWWIDVPGFNLLHCVNAWEEDDGDTIVIVATNALAVDQFLEQTEFAQLTLEKITIDVKANTVQRRPVCPTEFGVINPAYAAKKNRYVYAPVLGTKRTLGFMKLDLSLMKEDGHDCTVARRVFGPSSCGGEPFFVAREPNNPTAEEDDGYLLSYFHDESTNQSKFLVMDAKSPTLDIIAAVKLPQRVPDGFHGLFVSESDLTKL